MVGAEILLLAVGVVFYIASFFITEKLGPGELNKIGELSNEEIQRVMERELSKVTAEIEGRVEEKAEEALEKSERSMEKECNEKIMAISEYSDTIVESMNKTHNEIMFLYSMLNDKHAELTDFSAKLQGLASDLQRKDDEITSHLSRTVKPEEAKDTFIPVREEASAIQAEDVEEIILPREEDGGLDDSNHNAAILALHKEGKSAIDIARELALGLGEVQLVIGLYEGKREK